MGNDKKLAATYQVCPYVASLIVDAKERLDSVPKSILDSVARRDKLVVLQLSWQVFVRSICLS